MFQTAVNVDKIAFEINLNWWVFTIRRDVCLKWWKFTLNFNLPSDIHRWDWEWCLFHGVGIGKHRDCSQAGKNWWKKNYSIQQILIYWFQSCWALLQDKQFLYRDRYFFFIKNSMFFVIENENQLIICENAINLSK